MKKLITLICLIASLAGAEDGSVYFTVETMDKESSNIAKMLIEWFGDSQYYAPQPTNVFYKTWTDEMTGQVFTNLIRTESRPMTQPEKEALVLSGLSPVMKGTNIVAYTGQRKDTPTTYKPIMPRFTDEFVKRWEGVQKATTNDVYKRDGKVITAISVDVIK